MKNLQKTVANLSYDDLREKSGWQWTGAYDDDGNEVLVPVKFDALGRILESAGEVWCLCTCRFANGSEHPACAMCRGDSKEGPLALSVWDGERFVPVILPPAPEFVLEKEGPLTFCRRFTLEPDEVFPMEIIVVPRFAVAPHRRSVRIGISGIVPKERSY
jgi:hypothetical protein